MPSLSDRLKALGVQLGAENLHSPTPRPPTSLEQVLSGSCEQNSQGETFLVEEHFPLGSHHGHSKLELSAPLEQFSRCLGMPPLAELLAGGFTFLDTETTGLSGGTGTYTFLIGAGRFIGDEFVLKQFFLRDPSEEAAQLLAFEEFLAPTQAIVTFNGKSFDIPLLQTRFLTQGWNPPFGELIHIDLLHLARRLWRNRLPSRTLGNLEVQILDADRTQEDVPGWLIPSLYFEYLLDGDANRLKPVFYHNKMDVISLAVLMDHIASILNDPISNASNYGADLIALGKVFEQMEDLNTAALLYQTGLQHEDTVRERLPRAHQLEALTRLANIHKRLSDFETAVDLWQQAANFNHLYSFIELAKYYEHRLQDYGLAIQWTKAAITLVEDSATFLAAYDAKAGFSQPHWQEMLHHRLDRLQQKHSASI